jgi:hypothetical protein
MQDKGNDGYDCMFIKRWSIDQSHYIQETRVDQSHYIQETRVSMFKQDSGATLLRVRRFEALAAQRRHED